MYSDCKEPTIVAKNGLFFNTESYVYLDYGTQVIVPPFEDSDGPTLKGFTRLLFSLYEYNLGIPAAHLHDYMCRHKEEYDRKISTQMLVDLWVRAGLPKWKGALVGFGVNLYQLLQNGSEWKS